LATHGGVAFTNDSSFSLNLLLLDESFLLNLDSFHFSIQSIESSLEVLLLRLVLDDVFFSRHFREFSVSVDLDSEVILLAFSLVMELGNP